MRLVWSSAGRPAARRIAVMDERHVGRLAAALAAMIRPREFGPSAACQVLPVARRPGHPLDAARRQAARVPEERGSPNLLPSPGIPCSPSFGLSSKLTFVNTQVGSPARWQSRRTDRRGLHPTLVGRDAAVARVDAMTPSSELRDWSVVEAPASGPGSRRPSRRRHYPNGDSRRHRLVRTALPLSAQSGAGGE
jgi:hypothetical protein